MKPRFFVKLVAWLVAALLTLPVAVVIPMSFSGKSTFEFPPSSWSLRWYRNLFQSPQWTFALSNSLKVAVLTALISTVIGTMATVGLARLSRRISAIAMSAIMLPLIIPNILIALAIYATFLSLHLNGTIIGLVLADTAIALPFVVIAVNTRLRGIDDQLRVAALTLGATPFAAFRQVVLPLLWPGVVSALVLSFVTAFDEVIIALFLQTPANTTLSVQMFNSVSIEIDPTISAASSMLVVVVSAAILIGQIVIAKRGGVKSQ